MASKEESDPESSAASEETPCVEGLSKTEDKVGALISQFRKDARGAKQLKKCKSATFKVDGMCFTIGKSTRSPSPRTCKTTNVF